MSLISSISPTRLISLFRFVNKPPDQSSIPESESVVITGVPCVSVVTSPVQALADPSVRDAATQTCV